MSPRAGFDGSDSVTVQGATIPIAKNVSCYISATGSWADLSTARKFSEYFDIYYDRDPKDGGKVRIIVAN